MIALWGCVVLGMLYALDLVHPYQATLTTLRTGMTCPETETSSGLFCGLSLGRDY